MALAFQPPAALYPVQVPIDVDLQEHRRVVRRPAGKGWLRAGEPKFFQIELFDVGVDDPHRVVFSDVVVEALREQGDLASALFLDESLHHAHR
jgi:hypothetical protein